MSAHDDLDEGRPAAGKLLRDLVGQPAGKGGLARAGRTGQEDEAVQGRGLEGQVLADIEREQRLRQQPFLDAVGDLIEVHAGAKSSCGSRQRRTTPAGLFIVLISLTLPITGQILLNA